MHEQRRFLHVLEGGCDVLAEPLGATDSEAAASGHERNGRKAQLGRYSLIGAARPGAQGEDAPKVRGRASRGVRLARHVLIIEDDADVRSAIADALAGEGHSVAEAGDGIEGLERARDHRPDVILLDLMMPGMDGWAFREAQRRDGELAGVPVVIISACLPEDLLALDAAARLDKPFDLENLLALLDRLAAPS